MHGFLGLSFMPFQPYFCDWITARLPVEGCIPLNRRLDSSPDGEVLAEYNLRMRLRDSGDTSVYISRQDDGWLGVDGNLGRWGRSNNVWGYGVFFALARFLADVLPGLGLVQTGPAVLGRVDLTYNVSVGAGAVSAYTHFAAGVRLGRAKPTAYETGVAWGLGSRRWSAKIYDKRADLDRRGQKDLSKRLDPGFVRHEVTLRGPVLREMGLVRAADWMGGDMEKIVCEKIWADLDAGGATVDDALSDMSPRLASALLAYRQGYDYVAAARDGKFSRASLYRLRRDIRDCAGVDIFVPGSVSRIPVKVRQIQPVVQDVPDWYRLAA